MFYKKKPYIVTVYMYANSAMEAAMKYHNKEKDESVIGITPNTNSGEGDYIIDLLYGALTGLRTSHNGHEKCFCGEMPHEEDCQKALDAIRAANKYATKEKL